ncbi:transcriptional repressor UlaR, partial [Salmonella enterica subsp. enterica serovar Enteritidis str. SE30663]
NRGWPVQDRYANRHGGQKMLSVVGKLVALVDSSKIGERAGMLFSRADQIAMLITGKNANPQVLQQLEAQGVSILRV